MPGECRPGEEEGQEICYGSGTDADRANYKQTALEELQESIARQPGHSDARTAFGVYSLMEMLNDHMNNGVPASGDAALARKKRILKELRKAFELNPFDIVAADALSLLYKLSGAEDRASAWAGRCQTAMEHLGVSPSCAAHLLMSSMLELEPKPQAGHSAPRTGGTVNDPF